MSQEGGKLQRSPDPVAGLKGPTSKGGSVAEWRTGLRHRRAWVVCGIGVLRWLRPGFILMIEWLWRCRVSLRQTVHTHCASVHQTAKLVAAPLMVAGITAGLAESNGSLPPGLWLTSPAGWLPRTGISSGTVRSVIEYGLPLPFYF